MSATDPIDLLLDVADGDLDLSTGDLQLSCGAAGVKQAATLQLGFFLGEHFLDASVGVDWFGQILGVKNPSPAVIRQIFREQLLAVPYVTQIGAINFTLDRATREAEISWRVATDFASVSSTIGVTL